MCTGCCGCPGRLLVRSENYLWGTPGAGRGAVVKLKRGELFYQCPHILIGRRDNPRASDRPIADHPLLMTAALAS